MISSDFQNRFALLTHEEVYDKKTWEGVSQINNILQKTPYSLLAAKVALGEIGKIVTTQKFSQGFKRDMRSMLRDEVKRYEDIARVAWSVFCKEGVEAVAKDVRGDEIFSSFALTFFDKIYAPTFEQHHLQRITEKELEDIYHAVIATLHCYAELYIKEEVCRGRAREEVVAEVTEGCKEIYARLEQDRSADKLVVTLLAEEIRLFPALIRVCDSATSCESWGRARDILIDVLVLVRCTFGRDIPQELEQGSLSFAHALIRRTILENKDPIRKMGDLLRSASQEIALSLLAKFVEKWIEPTQFACMIKEEAPQSMMLQWIGRDYTGFSSAMRLGEPFRRAYEGRTVLCLTPLLSAFKGRLQGVLKEFPEELAKVLLDAMPLEPTLYGNDSFERKFNTILVGKQAILEAYKSGVSLEFFKNSLFSLFEQGSVSSLSVRKIFSALTFLRAHGCSALLSERLVSCAGNFLQHPLSSVLRMSDDQVQRFIALERSPDDNAWVEDQTQFLLRWYGVPLSFMEKVEDYLGPGIPSCFLEEFGIRLFSGMTEAEIDSFFDRFGALVPQIEEEELRQILGSRESREFFFRVMDPCEADYPLEEQSSKMEAALAIHRALMAESIPIAALKIDYVYKLSSKLTPQEACSVLSAFPKGAFGIQYLAETLGVFGSTIATMPLHFVATEPLIRFLSSMPWQKSLEWLEAPITTDGGQEERYKTLSLEQKEKILTTFRRHADLHRVLVEKFGMGEERVPEPLPMTSSSDLRSLMGVRMHDRNDPLDLMAQVRDKFDVELPAAIVHLLLCAKEESICGERTLLKWGNASAPTSFCTAQDTSPLFVYAEGKTRALYQGGFLNDPAFALSAVSLRRNIIEYCQKNHDGLDKVFREFAKGGPGKHPDEECTEICHEVRRIVDHLKESYPGLSMDGEKGDPLTRFTVKLFPRESLLPELIPSRLTDFLFSYDEIRECTTRFLSSVSFTGCQSFVSLLKQARKIFIKMPGISNMLNTENYAQQHALMFMTLLLVLRHVQFREAPGVMNVALSPFVRFRLKSLFPQSFELRPEDNFGLNSEQLEELSADYSFHTISPLTPNKFFSPQKFSSLVRHVQNLSDWDFYILLNSTISLFTVSEDGALFQGVSQSMEQWQKALHEINPTLSLGTSDDKALLAKITEKYIGYLLTIILPLREGARIPLDRSGIGDYSPENEVPEFIYSEGNFSSALCKFMRPRNLRLHDGNCAINAFLLGYTSTDLNDENVVSTRGLYGLVARFRQNIVQYASANQERLRGLFGEEDVSSLIRLYNDGTQTEWTGSIVWECAAKLFKREIHVYSSPNEEGVPFSIGARDEVEPALSFRPEGEPAGPPIYLMHFGSHYCNLVRKPSLSLIV